MNAPSKIPKEMYKEFVMDEQIPIEFKYENACSDEIQAMINNNFTKENFETLVTKVKNKQTNYYGPTDTWLYHALNQHPIEGKDVCMMGSTCPWYETVCILYGANSCTVIEYSKRESFHNKIIYKQPHEITNEKFDACFSISSYEHDGLGRYGDPLNPNGDLAAMYKTKYLLKPNALFYLSVPIGLDKIVFNLHRVYGKIRLPLLLEGWEVINKFGFNPSSFTHNINGINGTPYQPLYILKDLYDYI